jgi:hypothetical protein
LVKFAHVDSMGRTSWSRLRRHKLKREKSISSDNPLSPFDLREGTQADAQAETVALHLHGLATLASELVHIWLRCIGKSINYCVPDGAQLGLIGITVTMRTVFVAVTPFQYFLNRTQ